MQSPVANKKQMIRVDLEEGLSVFQCPETSGIFLPITSYVRWLGKQGDRLPHLLPADSSDEELIEDSSGVKLCPESGQIMQRYRVGHGFSFYIDRAPSGSLWFDKGEWESLRQRQFHDELHLIFTSPWQDRVREEERLESERALLQQRLGEPLLTKLEELGDILGGHEYQNMALAHLQRYSKENKSAHTNPLPAE